MQNKNSLRINGQRWVGRNRGLFGGFIDEWASMGDVATTIHHALVFTDKADCERFCAKRNAESGRYNFKVLLYDDGKTS